jgi:hypothetical protein
MEIKSNKPCHHFGRTQCRRWLSIGFLSVRCASMCKFICVRACMSSRVCKAVYLMTLETPYAALNRIKSEELHRYVQQIRQASSNATIASMKVWVHNLKAIRRRSA